MAEPVNFDQANIYWYGEGEERPLPVFRDPVDMQNISCWELTAEEQTEVLETGKIWLHVWGNHPAVYVSGECPFEGGEE